MSEWNDEPRRLTPDRAAKAVSIALVAVGLGAVALKGVQTWGRSDAPAAAGRPAATTLVAGPTHKHARVTFVTAENAFRVPLPSRATPSLLVAHGMLYALVDGELRSAPLADLLEGAAEMRAAMPPGRRVDATHPLGPLRHMAWDDKLGLLFCLDDRGLVASYEPALAAWALASPAPSPARPYGAIAVQAGHVSLIGADGTRIWPLGSVPPPTAAAAGTPPVAIAPMGLDRLLALEPTGTLRTARHQAPDGMVAIAPMPDLGHGAGRPARWVDLDVKAGSKVAFAADGANGRIVAVLPDSGRVMREIVVLPPAGEPLGLRAIAIADEKLLAVVGDTLVAYPKHGAFHEVSITDTTCPPELPALLSAH